MKPAIQGIIFDYGGVISQPLQAQSIAEMWRLLAPSKPDDCAMAYRLYRPQYDAGLRGEEYWSQVLTHLGKASDAELIQQLIVQDVTGWGALNEAMLQYIRELKQRGIRLAILSNMTFETLKYLRDNFLGLEMFNHCCFSCEVKMIKPQPEIYRHCAGQLGLRPAECLFIDDTLENVTGAQRAGLVGVHYQKLDQLKTVIDEYL